MIFALPEATIKPRFCYSFGKNEVVPVLN